MIQVFNTIHEIQQFLEKTKKQGILTDYRISLKLDNRLVVHALVLKKNSLNFAKRFTNPKIDYIEVTQDDIHFDPFYQSLFSGQQEKIDLTQRRRYRSLLEVHFEQPIQEISKETGGKVVSFYSYKGGMGRTTSMALFATYYARKGYKVALLDFDFEAPGFMNFFGMNEEILASKKGIVEYIMDKDFSQEIDFDNYYYTVAEEFAGNGAIYMVPAGNNTNVAPISNMPRMFDSHLKQYLEALARIDFANKEKIVPKFRELIQEIDNKLQPDVILIDSRTGMNDIFGILSFYLSDLVVGFFGASNQNRPGLHYFLDAVFNESANSKTVILANSIISSERYFDTFSKDIDETLNKFMENEPLNHQDSKYSSPPIVNKYPLYREGVLEEIGVPGLEQKDRFIKFIEAPSYHYKDFLEGIAQSIEEISDSPFDADSDSNQLAEEEIKVVGKIDIPASKPQLVEARQTILKRYWNNKPNLYPEDQAELNTEDYSIGTFYFRQSMKEIFNPDKFILRGGKGTGKTFLYRAFKSDKFKRELLQKLNGASANYEFTLAVPLELNKMFHVDEQIKLSELTDPDYFFHRFWIIYIHLQLAPWIKENGISQEIEEFPVRNDTPTTSKFKALIEDDAQFEHVEENIKSLDKALSTSGKKITILFDQLDKMVKPKNWDIAITPLLEIFRARPYTHIIPKIFIRTDLYNKLGNLNNKQELKSQIVSLEWSRDEIFAFFFKVILFHAKKELFTLVNASFNNKEYTQSLIASIDEENQIPLQENKIKPFVEVFFGKWADIKGTPKYGSSYDWFYKNLQNADGTISLRPFIDLINNAVKLCHEHIKDKRHNQHNRFLPILSSHYFAHADIREKAVERHYEELAFEAGNEDIKTLFDFIKKDVTPRLRLQNYSRAEFNELLAALIKKHKGKLRYTNLEDLRDLLIVNGIVAQKVKSGGYTGYSFALLYKYFLGLSDKNRKN